ncbi:MAG: hypothetical protein JNG89_06895 [Planctomycetaceae bacterium]|nr:hypothetical protein [Planctomycetaceae bacterium]
MRRSVCALVLCVLWPTSPVAADEPANLTVTGRRPAGDDDLSDWLRNAVQAHRYSPAETGLALDLSEKEVSDACARLNIDPAAAYPAQNDGRLWILPYPGGRHPRIGFLEGAVDPQRETKFSVFTPWQPADGLRADYVVADIPEAIWSNLGLTYLAHTHVPTVWTKSGITLPVLEWTRHPHGILSLSRTLPNGIAFSSLVVPEHDHVAMRLTLTNGTDQALTDLRVQNCVMLKAADGFNPQTNDNKVSRAPYTAVRNAEGNRWILTAWKPNHRTWANDKCPCLHSDPKFPDCAPGETKTLRGWLSFYEGTDIEAEFDRIEALNWWDDELPEAQ